MIQDQSNSEYIPGTLVINEMKKDWGIGQIQSSVKNILTINFENVGKKVINIDLNIIKLKIIKK
tara:strand:+ start:373 stop:564 length:192 start_codon:yes stop_codon:yes gene_type:complete